MIKHFTKHDVQNCQIGDEIWDCSRLFHLTKDFEPFEMPLKHINMDHNYECLTLREMAGHMYAVLNADLSYPIILDEDGIIMDGRHRLMKCILEDIETIKAVRFGSNPSPCRYKTPI